MIRKINRVIKYFFKNFSKNIEELLEFEIFDFTYKTNIGSYKTKKMR